MDNPDLGPCCICEIEGPQVRNIIMLNQLSPIPGKGWGCFACGLPRNGAVAVVCDDCLDGFGDLVVSELRFACRGYPGKDGRVPIEELTGEFDHNVLKHPELNTQTGAYLN
jgi:hypothetical protein